MVRCGPLLFDGAAPRPAPEQPTPQERMLGGYYNSIARLTLTYQDIFMRKHAGVFDYIDHYGWQCVALLADIPKDLEDLNNAARALLKRAPSAHSDK
ncbi:MAG: hypothetical protein M1296_03060 [Chloroflexi bacterium]|nr:hypothetical protein [Chloroflexota bacterium]